MRAPADGGAASVLALQRSAGNRCVAAALGQRPPPPVPARPATTRLVPVQRLASWEHKALGDIDPGVLEVIASGRDAAKSATKTVAR